jgi:hypothetical protein
MLKHLTRAGIINTVKNGCVLTNRGMGLYKQLRVRLSGVALIDARQLALDKVNAAILVRGAGRFVKKGIEQRDAAIREGATGACTLIIKGRAYVMPTEQSDTWKLERNDPLAQDFDRLLGPGPKDAIIVVSANERSAAEEGAMAAALTLLK